MKKRNPFKTIFLVLTLICVLSMSVVYICANYVSIRKMQTQENENKIGIVMADFQKQVEQCEKIALKLSVNMLYQPYYYETWKYNEKLLLEDFTQYRYYSVLTEDYFLYYHDDRIFHSSNHVIGLSTYLRRLNHSDAELLKNAMEESQEDIQVLPAGEKIFLLIPFKSTGNTAVFGAEINKKTLEERFLAVSGGLSGKMALYYGGTLLYSNSTDEIEREDSLGVSSTDGNFTFYYDPENSLLQTEMLFSVNMLILLVNVICLFGIATIFAKKQYQPILDIQEKYHDQIFEPEGKEFDNALDEIDYLVKQLLHNNELANQKIERKQEMLKTQVLRMILFGRYSSEMKSYLELLKIYLPGPYFYVICILAEEDEQPQAAFEGISRELEQYIQGQNGIFAYAYHHVSERQIFILCSIEDKEQQSMLTEDISSFAAEYVQECIVGEGNCYPLLSRCHTSCMESVDEVWSKKQGFEQKESKEFVFNSKALYKISSALNKKDEEEAIRQLHFYAEQLENREVSVLLQQFVFANFASELTKIAYRNHIDLPNDVIGGVITAKNVEEFKEGAEKLIHNIAEEMLMIHHRKKEAMEKTVCTYVQEHFMEYDLSIERIAEELNMNVVDIRESILTNTGKQYKDYVIELRISYAKQLLAETDRSVAEICQCVGYGNTSHFIKLFKEATGVTPAKYEGRKKKK